jgi:glutathione synthase/RimK-type ligase-like ATP-grasp enzyme
MFIMIQEYIEDPQALVCVLIGEVVGFARAQQSALTDTVPTFIKSGKFSACTNRPDLKVKRLVLSAVS